MTDRDRLIELFKEMDKDFGITCPNINTDKNCKGCKYQIRGAFIDCNYLERKADYLLANGVIVPSFKVGDKVYQIDAERVYELDITDVYFYKKWIYETKGIDFDIESIGKSVFLTKEEAEQKLKELKNNGL